MKYVSKLFTIPEDLVVSLQTERNQSARVSQALKDYYDGKNELGSLNRRLEAIEDQVTSIRRTLTEIKQLMGGT